MSEPFIGEIRMFPYSFPPYSWAYCLGQRLDVRQFQALYAVIGNNFGGTPGSTMNTPNLKGLAVMHAGQGPGLTNRPFAYGGGNVTETITPYQMPAHTHQLNVASVAGTTPEPANQLFAYQAGDPQSDYKQPPYGDLVEMSPKMLSMTGGNYSHENRQPYLTLAFCIALDGIFPMRN
ncbi:phage tail protein [Hahella sp. KA22]|uniref:phage tail protein n=1 Tax=Hahella sp. KA22 TaxID=1628392 RepID=UPI000FDE28E4|nr:tail fiber protein [Hahella sp. KA22]AZZ94468.1 phage tail protein [Hahella sp. KA22]QAY57841.1 phage tail protein [Hahella sp. KA22]